MDYQNFSQLNEFGDHESSVSQVVFFPYAKKFLSVSGEKVYIWDLVEKRILDTLHIPEQVNSVEVDSNEEKLLFSFREGGLQTWDIMSKKPLYLFPDREGDYKKISLTSDGRYLGVMDDFRILIYNTRSLRKEREQKFSQEILSFSWSVKNDAYLVGSAEGNLSFWELDSARKIWEVYENGSPIRGTHFHKSNEYLCSQQWARLVVRFRGNGMEAAQLVGHEGEISHCFFEPLGLYVLSASLGENGDGTLRIFEMASKRLVNTIECESMTCLALSPDGKNVIAGTNEGTLVIFGIKE